jgi:hypothetical protein
VWEIEIEFTIHYQEIPGAYWVRMIAQPVVADAVKILGTRSVRGYSSLKINLGFDRIRGAVGLFAVQLGHPGPPLWQ